MPNAVTVISNYAFYGTTSLKEFVLPSELKTIGDNAFNGTRIRELNIPSKVTSIGSSAFAGDVALTSLTIPGNVKTIGNSAFSGCANIASLTLNSGITTIGEYAFQNLAITTVVIPNSVTSIGQGAFKGCNSLTSISVPFVGKSRTATVYEAVFGYIFGYTTTQQVSTGSSTSLPYKSSSETTFTDTKYSNVTGAIWQYSCFNYYGYYYYNGSTTYALKGYCLQSYFYYIPTTLTTVVITDATVIPEEAFYNCANITSVTMNNDVTTIGQNAFENCTKLATANIGTGITTIRADAFKNCSALTSITVPYGVNTMGANAFTNCSSLSINCQIEEQPSAWASSWNSSSRPVVWGYGCEGGTTTDGIKWISIDGTTARVRGYEGSATSLTIPSSISGKTVNRIAANAFSGNTTLTSVVIPNSVTIIEANAFANMTALSTVVIPNSVTQIQANAFTGCSVLSTVVIPNSVTEIQANVFTGCSALSMLCESSAKPSGWASSWNSSNRPVVWKYAGTKGVTAEGLSWALVTGDTVVIYGYSGTSVKITIPTTIDGKTVSGISESAFRGNTTITSVFIPAYVEFIGAYAFSGCSNLKINCEIASAPSGWASTWKDSDTTVYWSM